MSHQPRRTPAVFTQYYGRPIPRPRFGEVVQAGQPVGPASPVIRIVVAGLIGFGVIAAPVRAGYFGMLPTTVAAAPPSSPVIPFRIAQLPGDAKPPAPVRTGFLPVFQAGPADLPNPVIPFRIGQLVSDTKQQVPVRAEFRSVFQAGAADLPNPVIPISIRRLEELRVQPLVATPQFIPVWTIPTARVIPIIQTPVIKLGSVRPIEPRFLPVLQAFVQAGAANPVIQFRQVRFVPVERLAVHARPFYFRNPFQAAVPVILPPVVGPLRTWVFFYHGAGR